MAGDDVALRIALSSYGHTRALKTGAVPIAGVRPVFAETPNMIEAYRRMVRDVAFDISELAPTTYFAARLAGAPYKALPIFVMRRFHHGGLLCRADARIAAPRDLAGKRFGLRAYSVTSAVWTRAILAEDHGLDLQQVTWVTDSEEHVETLRLPPNVQRAPANRSLGAMLMAGELDAAFAGLPGMGAPGGGGAMTDGSRLHELFADPAAVEADWYRRTGIYPIHGLIVIRDDVRAASPWLPRALYTAFCRAKDAYVAALLAGLDETGDDRRYRSLMALVGDPLPYGRAANRAAIDSLVDHSYRQGLIARRPDIDELFIDIDG